MKPSAVRLSVISSVISLIGASQTVFAMSDAELDAQLEIFKTHTKTFMNTLPPKRDLNGNEVKTPPLFSKKSILSRDFVTQKDAVRNKRFDLLAGTKAEMQEKDIVLNLIDDPNLLINTLERMETLRLKGKKMAESPWSDTYWPIYAGQTANRYADEVPDSEKWEENYKNFKDSPPELIVKKAEASSMDNLSPAEKYDLLVGDSTWGLTKSQWAAGEEYVKNSPEHKVETWMGLCHGWSPAAISLPRPNQAIDLVAADGKTKIKFYPSDIKALTTLLWAEAQYPTQYMGGRCNEKEPKQDENGRILSEECFDTNPGSWHQLIVNQIGQFKRSFVVDVTYDYEVWNQPVYGYRYKYFNPETGKAVKTLAEATVKMSNFKSDKFKKYRSPKATKVVGIDMTMGYVVETQPTHALKNSAEDDVIRTADYMFRK